MTPYQRSQALLLSATFTVVTALVLGIFVMLPARDWSVLETRGVSVEATITGKYWTKKYNIVIHYDFPIGGGKRETGEDQVEPLVVFRRTAIGGSLPVVYDPQDPERSALAASFPNDGGRPYTDAWRHGCVPVLCIVGIAYIIVLVGILLSRGTSAKRRSSQ